MSERTFQQQLELRSLSSAIISTIDALTILPRYEANSALVRMYEDRLEKLIAEMKEELK